MSLMTTVWIVQQFRMGPGRQLLQTTVFASHAAAKERFLEALNERDIMTEIRETICQWSGCSRIAGRMALLAMSVPGGQCVARKVVPDVSGAMIGPLRLDYDGRRPPKLTRAVWLLGRAGYRLAWWSECRSPGGKGWHVEAGLRPQPRTCVEVVALQAALGSDPAREACNVTRARMVDRRQVSPWWARRWNVLYVG